MIKSMITSFDKLRMVSEVEPLKVGKLFILVLFFLWVMPVFTQVNTAWVGRYNGFVIPENPAGNIDTNNIEEQLLLPMDKVSGRSAKDFLMPDDRFDLKAIRVSGYQGPLDFNGFNVRTDPHTGEPILSPIANTEISRDPDDTSWSPLGSGMNSDVWALAVYDNKLIAGGWFTTAGGVSANHIAAWDGSSWDSLGSGMGGQAVWALIVYDNKLIAGGTFSTAGGVSANSIASWDGSSWSPLGSGINGDVFALAIYDNKLIAGGGFTTAGEVSANNIASWNGSSWSPLGEGIATQTTSWGSGVYGLTVYDNKLIAGGPFDTAGVVRANCIASWDGSSWDSLGSGMWIAQHPFVWPLTVYDNKLIAGGYFTTAGGVSANCIASWDGSSWFPLGSGMDMLVCALTVYNNKLIAGGYFGTAGGVSANDIASWDGSSWCALGSGMNSIVFALAIYDNKLIAGGEFTSAGGKVSAYIAQWTKPMADFSGNPRSGFRPLSVQFTDQSGGEPTSWFWDFGDGNTAIVQNPIHTYTDTGYYDVKLIVSDSTHVDSLIQPDCIAVFDTLTVDFTAQPTHGREPLTVSFQPSFNELPDSITWYFGDGQTSHQLNPTHIYTDYGSYDVKLVAELFGYRDSLTKEDYIQVSGIKADFGADIRCGSAPLMVTFSDSSTSTYPIIAWFWDFDDGDTSNKQNPTHQFTSTGVFDITLIVSDSIGTDTLTKQDYITTQDSVSANFVGLPNSGRSPLTVMFEPILEGIANQYFWDFGDGDTSSLRNPIHTFTAQGKYDVKFKVSLELDDCNQVDSIIKEDYIVVNDLNPKFSANPTAGVAPFIVQFTDESSGNPNIWFWNFGDGHTSSQQHPQHQYGTAGDFDVFLRVSNFVGVDSLLKLEYIHVDTPYADLFAEIYSSSARPGFYLDYYFVWTNIGTIPGETCTLKALLPPEMAFYGLDSGEIHTGTYLGYTFSGDTIIVPLSMINPSGWLGGYVYAYGNLPSTVQIGDTLVCQMWLTSTTPDRDYDNNFVLYTHTVIGSWDPNDKLAYPQGEGIFHGIKSDQRLEYTIQFENKAEATAEAIYIRVVDTLDQDLDWGTLAIGAMSHPDKCGYEFNPYTGEIIWYCDSIMLPPNVNPPEGEGYFTYSISPKPNLIEGEEIANTAWIRFDYNDWMQAPEEGPVIRTIKYPFIVGDANGDRIIDVGDVVYLINYLFKNGPAPNSLQAGDANCDEVVDVGDVVYLINYLFKNGPQPSC